MSNHRCQNCFLGLLVIALVGCTIARLDSQATTPTAKDTELSPSSTPATSSLPPTSTLSATSPLSFEELCGMDANTFREMDLLAFREWVKNRYGINPRESILPDKNEATLLQWGNSKAYFLDNSLVKLELTSYVTYTLKTIINGLGEPETVFRNVLMPHENSVYYQIELAYPTLGIYLLESGLGLEEDMFSPAGQFALKLDENMQIMPKITCLAPFPTVEQALQVAPEITDDERSYLLRLYTTWPGINAWLPFASFEN